MKRWSLVLSMTMVVGGCRLGNAGVIETRGLQSDLDRLVVGFDGRVGICVREGTDVVSVKGDERFSMQSVMKMVVGMAVMEAVDTKGWKLEEEVVVRQEDLSLFVQPLSKLVGKEGWRTTVGDLVRRAVVDSDCAASDILVRKLGGSREVEGFLERKGVKGVRFDRDERHLQTETVGLEWKAEYVDAGGLQRAIDAVPTELRERANREYQRDVRDTATPQGMGELLERLGEGKLLSAGSTTFLMGVMEGTVTFPDRLKAGVPTEWKLGHKTGTSGTYEGVTIATNDVGVLIAPDGGKVSVVVFVGDSGASAEKRAALMAGVARAVVRRYEMGK